MQMNSKKRKNIIIGILMVLVVVITIGYSVLSSRLKINGTSSITSDFNVLFTDIQEGLMNEATTVNKKINGPTTATFQVDLKKPGSNAEYIVTVENLGKIDATLESIEGITEANEKDPTYITFNLEGIKEGDNLNIGETKTFKVKVTYNESATEIPEESKQLTLKLNYVQKTNSGSGGEPGEQTISSVTTNLLSSGATYNYMGGTYIKGGIDGKQQFYNVLISVDYFSSTDEIDAKFFDSEGNFIPQNFEDWGFNEAGITEEYLADMGVDTVFECIFQITPDELFSTKANDTNYVWFNGFMWRIMGVNADGSIRMITEENVTSIPWGESDTAEQYDNSYANDWLNNYFYPKLKNKDLLVSTTWCSETTTDRASARTTCQNNLSSIPQYVGLISLDEFNLANGTTSYLTNSQVFRTLTPYSASSVWHSNSAGEADDVSVSGADGLRFVINIDPDVQITSGNGTFNSPYQI